MNGKKVDILGVKIDDVSMEQALERIEGWLEGGGHHYIATPNPEFLIAAQKDEDFRKVLNNADLSIPDGVGLQIFAGVKNRVTGTDLMEKLIEVSAEKGFTVGLLGGQGGVAKKASECLSKKYSGLKVIFAEDGPEVDTEGNEIYDLGFKNEDHKSYLLNLKFCDLLFVAFGQVKQEKWISKNLSHLPAKVMMGVGGAFDYFSGSVPRAPLWMRKIGLEWLFRLITQPWRIKRQLVLIEFAFKTVFG